MIYVTGDTHCDFKRLSFSNWPAGKKLTKKDYLIICGDFGLLWTGFKSNVEIYWTKWLDEKPWTTLFVAGNHENYLRLNQLEEIDMFDSKVGKVSNSIYHLKHGEIYIIDNKKIFTFGGAVSIDKHLRKEHISWWSQEVASQAEMNYGFDNLSKHNNKVDFIVTHTIPYNLYDSLEIPGPRFDIKDPTENYLEEICNITKFKKLFCGHYHMNKQIKLNNKSYQVLYDDIITI